MVRAARAIGRAEAFAHDAFKAELTGVAEYDVAGLVDVIVEVQCPGCLAQHLGELALALLQRRAAQILTAELEEIEGE
jgi:hypothetical protein